MTTVGELQAQFRQAVTVPGAVVSRFAGHVTDETDGLPVVGRTYTTVRYGELVEFTASRLTVGDTVDYAGQPYRVVYATRTRGDVHVPDRQTLVLAPARP